MRWYICCTICLLYLLSSKSLAQPFSGELKSLFEQGKTLYDDKQFIKATAVFTEFIDLGKSQETPFLLAQMYHELGIFYDIKKNDSKAIEYLFRGIEMLSEHEGSIPSNAYFIAKDSSSSQWGIPFDSKDLRDQGAQLLCILHNRIGGVYFNQRDHYKAKKYWNKTLDFSIANKNAEIQSSALNNLGEIERANNNLNQALSLYRKSLQLKKQVKDSTGIAIVLSNIGSIYIQNSHLDSAKLYYDQSFNYMLDTDSLQLRVGIFEHYGIYYKTIGQLKEATRWFQKTLNQAQQVNDLNYTLQMYRVLAELYEEQNLLDSALYYQKKQIALDREINFQKKEKLALEIEAQYLINEKEQELFFLKEKNKIEAQNVRLNDSIQWASITVLIIVLVFTLVILRLRNKNNKELESHIIKINQQNKEKDILLKEIHHRVKNNLQVITSLLSLQSYNIEDIKTKELFSYSQYRINSMAMIHEMLYQANDLSKINYGDYLKQLIDKLILSMKGHQHQIEVQLDVPNVYLNIDTAIPLGLLINEIITNALKYGIPDDSSGTLSIKIIPLESPNFKLEIGDNGIGFSETAQEETKNSLGLRLIRQLTLQLNGNIERDTQKQGTNYVLSFQEVEQ